MKRSRRIPEVLTAEESALLLEQPNPRYPTGLRNFCIMRMMLDIGLRCAECLQLTTRDVHWLSGKVHIREGKGGKDRIVWCNEGLMDWLRRWKERRPASLDNETLFVTLQGKPVQSRYVRTMVKRYAQKAGILKDVHPHMLRHTFATDLYRETTNIRLVQKALGHADLSSTMIYTHIVDRELETAMRLFRLSSPKPD